VDVRFDLLRERNRSSRLTPDVRNIYPVHLRQAQLLRVVVQQRGIDVRLEVFSPANSSLLVVDSSNDSNGPEPLLLVAEEEGTYEIALSTGTLPTGGGRYSIETVEVREATRQDRLQATALERYYRAKESLRARKGQYSSELVASFKGAAVSLDESRSAARLRADAWLDLGQAFRALSPGQESVSAFLRSAALYRQVGDKKRQAIGLNEAAQGEQNLFQIDRSVGHYRQAIALARAARDASTESQALTNLGGFYAERAQEEEARRYLSRAIPLSISLHDENGEARALNALGQLYIRLGEYDKALSLYKSELRRLRLAPSRQALAMVRIGDTLASMGLYKKSFQYYRWAFDLQKQDKDPLNRAATLVGVGFAYQNSRDFANALDSYQQALKIYRLLGDFRNQAAVVLNLGWTLGELGRFEDARESFRSALNFSRSLENPVLEAGALAGSAWVEQKRGNLVEAQREGEKALERIESIRSQIEKKEYRLKFFAIKQRVYDLLVDVLMERYRQENDEAFLGAAIHVGESSQARVLTDALSRRYDSSSASGSDILGVQEIQQKVLGSDDALLEYWLGDRQSYLWWITRSEIKSFRLPPRAKIESLVSDLYQSLQMSQISSKRSEAIALARHLGEILLGPVADRLSDRRLLIVVSGKLLSIPFGVFPDPTVSPLVSEGKRWPQPLIVRHEIVQEPSASALAGIRAAARGRGTGTDQQWVALIADGVFSRSDERVPPRFRSRIVDEGQFGRLPGSAREAESVARIFPMGQVRKFLGFEAKRSLFTDGKLQDASVIDLATHGSISSEHPEDAAITLSRVDEHGREIEGSLSAEDVSQLDLRANLVVLSSCRSAVGRNVPGEGIVGLPQAFLSAGVSGVVTSLWNVDDERTSQLMALFYRQLQAGRATTISGALRAAQIEMWKTSDWNAPWFWGAFIAEGDWSFQPIATHKKPTRVSSQGGDPRSSRTKQCDPPSIHHR
jgi:CHAT domain-containing protein/tetratricopeptide (TPR) repeat protein